MASDSTTALNEWDHRFMTLASSVGAWSKDRSTKVGCVIVDHDRGIRAIGWNGFPRGLRDDSEVRHERPTKYLWTEHAERNAIYQAGRMGVSLDGCTMYLPWFPCVDCARAIVQVGVARLVAFRPDTSDPQWGEHFIVAMEMLKEANVAIVWFVPTGNDDQSTLSD